MEDLKTGLITLILPFQVTPSTTVRVDPHSSFVSLETDPSLKNLGINLIIGHEKNVNHNSVAEKGVQELEEEILKLTPDNTTLDEITLSRATDALNRKIRYTKKSAKELLTKRNQDTGEDLQVEDKIISEQQHQRRRDNDYKMPDTPKRKKITKKET